MPLTSAQRVTVAADLLSPANAAAVGAWLAARDDASIAIWYNTLTAAFWVWRTSVSKSEIVQSTSVDGTTFNWTGAGFITRAQGERDAWREQFDVVQGTCNPSLANVRQAFADIFSGATAPAPANRVHIQTVCRRLARRVEQLLATGTGTAASPALLGYEGDIAPDDIRQALAPSRGE